MRTDYIKNKDSFTQFSKAIVKAYNELENIWQTVNQTAKEMNGKVLNIRFWDAINAKTDGVCGRAQILNEYGNSYKTLNLWVKSERFEVLAYRGYESASDYLYGRSLRNINDFATDGRIDAAKVENITNAKIDIIREKRAQYADAAKNYEKYQQAKKKAIKSLGEAFAKLNPLFVPSELHKFDWENATK